MNNNNENKINWLKTVRPLALILVLVLLLSYATYAWMKRDWARSVKQDNIKIQAGSSLQFIFDGGNVDDEISINELVGLDEFVFKSVSNCSGKREDFFGLNFGLVGKKDHTFFKLPDSDTKAAAENYGYLVVDFTISIAEGGSPSDIYIAKASQIAASATEGADKLRDARATKAIRISVTVDGKTVIFANNDTMISDDFPNDTQTWEKWKDNSAALYAISNEQVGGKYIADGAKRYNDEGEENPTVTVGGHTTKNLKKGIELVKLNGESDVKICELTAAEPSKNVTVCIWLEGEDPRCEDVIAGAAIDLLLKFTATPSTT